MIKKNLANRIKYKAMTKFQINIAKAKLLSNRGESLAEALVAILITSIALTILASMITTSSNSVRKSKENMNSIYASKNAIEKAISTGSVTSSDIDTLGGTSVLHYSGDTTDYTKSVTVYKDRETGFAGFKTN